MRTWQRLAAAGVFLSVTGLGVAAAAAPSWTTVRSANIGPYENELKTVTALSKTNAWAFGAYHKTSDLGQSTWLAEHWNGRRWSRAALPAAGCHLDGISDSSAVSAQNVWLLGYGNGYTDVQTCLLHYHAGRWSQAPLTGLEIDVSLSWGAIAAAPGNRAWLAGSQLIYGVGSVPTIAQFNGGSWHLTNVPLADGWEGGFAGLARIPRTSQWVAVGASEDVGDQGQIALAARFDGTSWSVQDVPGSTGVQLMDVLPLSPTNVWAVGYRWGTEPGEVGPVVAHYTAAGWRLLQVNPKLRGYLWAVAAHGPNDVVMVGRTGNLTIDGETGARTLVLRWNGSRLVRQPSPNPAPNSATNRLADVAAVPGTKQFWAVGGAGAVGRGLTARTLVVRGR